MLIFRPKCTLERADSTYHNFEWQRSEYKKCLFQIRFRSQHLTFRPSEKTWILTISVLTALSDNTKCKHKFTTQAYWHTAAEFKSHHHSIVVLRLITKQWKRDQDQHQSVSCDETKTPKEIMKTPLESYRISSDQRRLCQPQFTQFSLPNLQWKTLIRKNKFSFQMLTDAMTKTYAWNFMVHVNNSRCAFHVQLIIVCRELGIITTLADMFQGRMLQVMGCRVSKTHSDWGNCRHFTCCWIFHIPNINTEPLS